MAVYTAIEGSNELPWADVNTNINMASNNGYYVMTNSILTLPLLSSVDDIIRVTNFGATGFTIAQSDPSQQITGEGAGTTPGSAGSIVATLPGTSLELVCLVANTSWQIISGIAGVQFN